MHIMHIPLRHIIVVLWLCCGQIINNRVFQSKANLFPSEQLSGSSLCRQGVGYVGAGVP